ncbi:hypothetical protein MKX01_000259 [Papaver californicum]|nr:hypothetical protein MKX01_000259 [Papaver californicum]
MAFLKTLISDVSSSVMWPSRMDIILAVQKQMRYYFILFLNLATFSYFELVPKIYDNMNILCNLCNIIHAYVLRTLVFEDSTIEEKDGEWMHELALNNTVLETLNFYSTDIGKISTQDLELIARNCKSLVSVKLGDSEILDLAGFFQAAKTLEEFGRGSFSEEPDKYSIISFPRTLRSVAISYMGKDELPIFSPFASQLKKLDLLYVLFDTEDHCQLIQRCPNLEVLEVDTALCFLNLIGDQGLELLSQNCKRLKKLRIELGADDEQGIEEGQGVVTHRGLSALAQGCVELEHLTVYVSDITNEPLELMGMYWKNLSVKGLSKVNKASLYLCTGGMTDVGLGYIGQYGHNVRSFMLGNFGQSDTGLLEFAKGFPKLQKLEMRCGYFSECAVSLATTQLPSLSPPRQDIVPDAEGGEDTVIKHPPQLLAYYSLAGEKTDYPDTVIPINPS